jgi:ubiquinone/menaquinone biosynthesis C-methylase UbiE
MAKKILSMKNLICLKALIFLNAFLIMAQHNPANEYMHKRSPEELAKSFDNPERDEWQKPEVVIQKMGDITGKTVADIGCGSGYFATKLAQHGSHVICADPNKELLAFAQKKKDSLQLSIETRLIPYDHCGLKPNEADIALIVDTYHHIENRPAYFKELYNLLKPNGKIIIVDFFKKELPVGPPVKMKLSEDEVVKELKIAGLKNISVDVKSLPYQYIIIVEKK